jgi:hypothetical protein
MFLSQSSIHVQSNKVGEFTFFNNLKLTIMQTFKSLTFFVLIASFLFTGCKKDKETDIRAGLAGTYTGSQMYTIQWSNLSNMFADSTMTFDLVLTVSIDNSISGRIIINELGFEGYPDFPYWANAVTATNDGAMFNIPQQIVTTTYQGNINNTTISGFPCFPLNNTSYNGHYLSSNSQLSLAYNGTIQINLPGLGTANVPFIVINTCTKH